MRPVSSSKAESGAGRKLADESCIPNLLEFGVLVLCISKASPAFSIAALISVCLSVCLSPTAAAVTTQKTQDLNTLKTP
jgi:hypothetical protein